MVDPESGKSPSDIAVAEFAAAWLSGECVAPEDFLVSCGELGESGAERIHEMADIFRAADASITRGDTPGAGAAVPGLGSIHDGFRILRELGRGGMGVVFEAEELETGRRVALKVLSAELRFSPEAAMRFRREARLAASVAHARCVFVYGFHSVDDVLAISMELVEGGTLEDVLARGEPVPIDQAVRWTMEILEGLEEAHSAGIVHRDLKPSNCFLTADGHVKIGDFGLSRLLDSDVKLTRTGRFLGSLAYSSPEQLSGGEVDERSDLYAVGATLYALLTGRAPHSSGRGEDFAEIVARTLTKPVQGPRLSRPEVSRSLERVVLRSLAKQARRRFRSAAEFGAKLAVLLGSVPEPAGLGVRFLAYTIDTVPVWSLIFLSEGVLRNLGYSSSLLSVLPDNGSRLAESLVFATAISGIYFLISEILWDSSIGKRLLGLRVSAAAGGSASPRQNLLRTAICQWALGAILFVPVIPLGDMTYTELSMSWGLVPIVLFISSRRSNAYRGIHELASGTCTVRSRAAITDRRADQLIAVQESVFPSLPGFEVGRYRVHALIAAGASGRLLLGKDEQLDRSVWLFESAEIRTTDPGLNSGQRSSTGLRWIERVETQGRQYDVHEAIRGEPLFRWINRVSRVPEQRVDWDHSRALLATLCEYLELHPRAIPQDQLWIDVAGRLRVVDLPVAGDAAPEFSPGGLVRRVGKALLRPNIVSGQQWFPRLPLHALALARMISSENLANAELSRLGKDLRCDVQQPSLVSRSRRLFQIALASSITTVWLLFVLTSDAIAESPSNDQLIHQITNNSPELLVMFRLLLTFWGLVILHSMLAVLLAFLFRGGLSLRASGLCILTHMGIPAGRFRCACRASLAWCSAPVLSILSVYAIAAGRPGMSAMFLGLAGLLIITNLAYSIWKPWTSFQDRICRTHLVSR